LLLGEPLIDEDLPAQRLGEPTALAVLSSRRDVVERLRERVVLAILVPAAGVAAFTLVTPITAIPALAP